MKNSTAQIRVHRYGIMTIWSISWVKGPDKNVFQNSFEVSSKEGDRTFLSRSQAKEHISYLLNSAPEEFKEDFLFYRNIFDDVV